MRTRRRKDSPAARVAGYFGRGLLVFVPTVGTLYTMWLVLSWLDGAIGFPVPGLGLVLTLALIVAIGFLASNVIGQAALEAFENAIRALPVVSLLYSSLKDLLGAFVGDKKSFDRPAMVSLDPAGKVRVFGFVTCERFDDVRLADMCAIYLPQAYNFAGNVLIVPKDSVELVDADPAQFMAFIVSGGVSAMGGARTVYDGTVTGSAG
ncbi:MAG: DUF502 domain-containing protein [Sandaracinaceae bacterium]